MMKAMANTQRVAAIIPAYNEENTIGRVVRVLKQSKEISEIIVVDDGSTDQTGVRGTAAGAQVVSLAENKGKGEAMDCGIAETAAPILLFMDADLQGLKKSHIRGLLMPVLSGHCDMMIGIVDRGKPFNEINKFVEAPFSGLRALKRELWEAVPQEMKRGFAIDSALSIVAKKLKKRVGKITLRGVRNVSKPRKRGLVPGLFAWIKMWGEIVFSLLRFLKI